jgi:aminoglycoside/choline kinase family phosphotransferase
MDYGRSFQDETDDQKLGRIFREADLPVARFFEASPDAGCLLVEDLGDTTLEQAVTSGSPGMQDLLRGAIDLAVAIADRGSLALARSDRAEGPRLDAARFRFELHYFAENYARRLRAIEPSRELLRALEGLADAAAEGPAVLCHRDYHSRNLMVGGRDRLTMVDIQDARWGPDTYDLVSFVFDPYLDLGDDQERVEALVDRYASARACGDRGFTARLEVVAGQRMLKCLGTYGHQVAVLGRERYRSAIAPTLRRLRTRLPAAKSTREIHDLLSRQGLLG